MPPLSFLLEQGQGLSSPCCSAAPGSTTEMSTSSPIHQCAICIQPLPVPVTHASWRTSCLQRTKKKACKTQLGLEKPQGASDRSPDRCSPSSTLRAPDSPLSCPPCRWPGMHPPGICHWALLKSWDRLEPASHQESDGAGSSRSINFSPHSPNQENFPEGPISVWPKHVLGGPRLKEKL